MQRLLQLRHKLHANPRVSNNEAETAAWLQEFMGAHSLQPSMSNVGGNAHRIAVPHFFFNSYINITDRPILAYAVGIRGLVGWLCYALRTWHRDRCSLVDGGFRNPVFYLSLPPRS